MVAGSVSTPLELDDGEDAAEVGDGPDVVFAGTGGAVRGEQPTSATVLSTATQQDASRAEDGARIRPRYSTC